MLRSAAALSVVAVGLLAKRVLSGTVAAVLPCEDGNVCLSDQIVAYKVTIPGWNTSAPVSFGSAAGSACWSPDGHMLQNSSPSSRKTGWRAGELLPGRTDIRNYFLHAVAGTVQPPDSLGAGNPPALAVAPGDPGRGLGADTLAAQCTG
jgi:hypothetical protein